MPGPPPHFMMMPQPGGGGIMGAIPPWGMPMPHPQGTPAPLMPTPVAVPMAATGTFFLKCIWHANAIADKLL